MAAAAAATAAAPAAPAAADVLDWLSRGGGASSSSSFSSGGREMPADRALRAIRSAGGSVPLGGGVGGANGSTPPSTPRGLLPSGSEGDSFLLSKLPAEGDKDEGELWRIVMVRCRLPVAVSAEQQEAALKTHVDTTLGMKSLRETDGGWRRAVDHVCELYYAERRHFFAARIALLRVALFQTGESNDHVRVVEEIVDQLLQEGLLEALVDEVQGRRFFQPPNFFQIAAQDVGQAHMARQWEMQFLEEEALLRELLLLVVDLSKERTTIPRAVQIAKTVHAWDVVVLEELFSPSTLALPAAQDKVRRVTSLGVLLAVEMIHEASSGVGGSTSREEVTRWTRSFFLNKLVASRGEDDAAAPSPIPGCLLLAWSALLANQYHQTAPTNPTGVRELEELLQQCLVTAEQHHSFHFLHAVLQELVQDEGVNGIESANALIQPACLDWKTIWQLPAGGASSLTTSVSPASKRSTRHQSASPSGGACTNRATIFQRVGADFLNDALVSLAFMENLDDVHQLNAMVKLVLPVLLSPSVAVQTLSAGVQDGGSPLQSDMALVRLLHQSREQLPQTVLPYLRLSVALCSNIDGHSSPAVLHQVLKEWGMPIVNESSAVRATKVRKQLPPDSYFRDVDGDDELDKIECTQTFLYQEDQFVVPVGTVGLIEPSSPSGPDAVVWCLSDQHDVSVWDLVFGAMERVVRTVQSHSLVLVTRSEDMEVIGEFFKLLVQIGRQNDGGQELVAEIGRRWSETRLRRWWVDHHLPFPQKFLPQLVRHHVTLPMLCEASREDLVAWGIRDRYTRDQILLQLGHTVDPTSTTSSTPRNAASGESDGLAHLLQLVMGFIDSFVHSPNSSAESDELWPASQLEFVGACFGALSTLLSTPRSVSMLVHDLGGDDEGCLRLIVKGTKKMFECCERHEGVYPVVLATQEIFLCVIRWLLAKEAQAVHSVHSEADAVHKNLDRASLVEIERIWFVGAVEFVLEILTTYETWKFATLRARCEVSTRCFRLVFVLLAGKAFGEDSKDGMLCGFQSALRSTMMTDTSVLMKLLRSTCAVLSTHQGHAKQWNSIAADSNDDPSSSVSRSVAALRSKPDRTSSNGDSSGAYPLTFGGDSAVLALLESLVISCLRLIDLIITQSDVGSVSTLSMLLTPIDDGGPKVTNSLTLVTLCAGYLSYPVAKSTEVPYWSLRVLNHACVALNSRHWDGVETAFKHSLIAQFSTKHDLLVVRDAFESLLRTSGGHAHVRKAIMVFLTVALESQPGFLSFLVFGDETDTDTDTNTNSKRFVGMIERLLMASEQLLEQASDFFCVVVGFVLQVWKGSVTNRHGLHQRIATSMKASPTFWDNLTRALKIQLPLVNDEQGPLNMVEFAIEGSSRTMEAYLGRSSAYGYLARGLILQIMTIEWHYKLSSESDNGLIDVLDKFRSQDLFAQWLRAFTRLDYSQQEFCHAFSTITPFRRPLSQIDLFEELPAGSTARYMDGFLFDVSTLKWQVVGGSPPTGSAARTALNNAIKCVKWCNLQGAYVHAQHFALTQWKAFMEVLSLESSQDAADGDAVAVSDVGSTVASLPPASVEGSATPRRTFKRKESMISSPPRVSLNESSASMGRASLSTSSQLSSLGSVDEEKRSALSNFSGDRTSYGTIRVLSEVLVARIEDCAGTTAVLDYCLMVHISELVELLVSMLHHQVCRVVQKTRNPRFSQTRPRSDHRSAESKLTMQKCVDLLTIAERALRCLDDSMHRVKNDVESDSNDLNRHALGTAMESDDAVVTITWKNLVNEFQDRIGQRNIQLRTGLHTVALLLVRHVNKLRMHDAPAATQPPLLHAKLVHHCMESIKLTDSLEPSAPSNQLFQASWCLFRELFDDFTSSSAALRTRQKLALDEGESWWAFVKELEHEDDGLRALLVMLAQWLRSPAAGKQDTSVKKQEQALQVLEGLVAIVWNGGNRELCRRTMGSASRLRLIQFITTEIVPSLLAQLQKDVADNDVRGYRTVDIDLQDGTSTEEATLTESDVHKMWCQTLDLVAGLVRIEGSQLSLDGSDPDAGLWDFLAHAEAQLVAVFHPPSRFTRALVEEHQSVLRLLDALSVSPRRRNQWRQAFPTSCAVLMEQSRQLLKRACILLGASASESNKVLDKKPTTPRGRSPSISIRSAGLLPFASLAYSHKTLLHEQVQPVATADKRNLAAYYEQIEAALVEVVRTASVLLTAWTLSLVAAESTVVVDGVRYLDDERLVPVLSFAPPSEALTSNSEPSLGHLCHAIEFLLGQIAADSTGDSTRSSHVSAVNACGLLFFKTFLLHVELYEHGKKDQDEFVSFFSKLNERLRAQTLAGIDTELFDLIAKVVSC